MTHAKLKNINHPDNAQYAFRNSKYRVIQIRKIYKAKRTGIEENLYTLYFLFPTKKGNNVIHYVFLDDDGPFLARSTSTPNDPTSFVKLPRSHSNFIFRKHKNTEIKKIYK